MMGSIEIDLAARPCFGVEKAIQMAENLLEELDDLPCLGDLIHNDEEIRRLENKGLRIVSHCQIVEQSGKKMLIRAHGETPSTYRIADNYDVEIVDATCPIVKQLQMQVAKACRQMEKQKGQLILYGDMNHAEVIALKGYCSGEFHIVRDVLDVKTLNTAKPTIFFSQTTKYKSDYKKVIKAFEKKRKAEKSIDHSLEVVKSMCKYVDNRDVQLKEFLEDKDVLIFVSSIKSSNGKYLFSVGKKVIKSAHFISNPEEIDESWLKQKQRIGISGAASTPLWLLNKTYAHIQELLK